MLGKIIHFNWLGLMLLMSINSSEREKKRETKRGKERKEREEEEKEVGRNEPKGEKIFLCLCGSWRKERKVGKRKDMRKITSCVVGWTGDYYLLLLVPDQEPEIVDCYGNTIGFRRWWKKKRTQMSFYNLSLLCFVSSGRLWGEKTRSVMA